jgi:xanthine dehydrogenase iron-sulfur cluster and FAD-binding subunit A
MVVACHAALTKTGGDASCQDMEKALDGNLCRCTGYRPILDACKVCMLPVLATTEQAFNTVLHWLLA